MISILPADRPLAARYAAMLLLPVFLLLASASAVVGAYVTLGQAHFLMTYVEQYRRGRYSLRGLALWLLLLAAALAALWLHQDGFIFFVSAFFMLHSLLDDHHLMRQPVSRTTLLASLPYLAIVLSTSADALLHTGLAPLVLPVAAAGYGLLAGVAAYHGFWRNRYMIYVLCLTPLLLAIGSLSHFAAVPPDETAIRIFGFIILSHYANWYVYVYDKYAHPQSGRVGSYLREIVLANLLTVGGYGLLMLLSTRGLVDATSSLPYLAVYYPPVFYVWTLMHLLVTLRYPASQTASR